eukprot:GFYU01010820.1.p1 GENE.GFYU01010820.1~~GFYU01010820.1.p1  ORF type:complete len:194 (-),score=38.13 GFYU01010820.1:88-669(-)
MGMFGGSSEDDDYLTNTPRPPMVGGAYGINPDVIAPVMGPQAMAGKEYLFPEELSTRRGPMDRMFYNIGSSYVSGALVGGTWGFVEGVNRARAQNRTSMKLRVNSVLNGMSKRGSLIGNGLGVMALMYTGIEGTLYYVRDTDDIINPVVAGATTGVIYRSTAGMRQAGVAGVLGAGLMLAVNLATSQSSSPKH